TSDKFITKFGNRRETGNMIITPGQPFSRRSTSQRAVNCFRCKESFPVWFDKSDRAFKLFDRNFGKPIRCFLVGYVINFAGSDFPPAFDPALAKMTFAVPNHKRLWRRSGNAEMRFVSH